MATRRARALREESTPQLLHDLHEGIRNLYNLRFRFATQQVGDVKEMRNARKEIARMKTILRERELAGEDLGRAARAEPPPAPAPPKPPEAEEPTEGDETAD
jgi:large subunit ribosomal protein L29